MGLLGSLDLKGAMKQVNEVLDAVDQVRTVKPSRCQSLRGTPPTGCRGFNTLALPAGRTTSNQSRTARSPHSMIREQSAPNRCFHPARSARESPHRVTF